MGLAAAPLVIQAQDVQSNCGRRGVLPMIRFSIATGLAISVLAIGQSNAAPLPREKCPMQASVDRKGSAVKTSKDALAIAKIYAASIYGVEKANIFEPRQAKMVSPDVWEIYGFTEGGIGRMVMQINARNGCLIFSIIQG
jgi:hypothetical protein